MSGAICPYCRAPIEPSAGNDALTLSGVMTFFFSTVYLQYHVNRIARWKKTGLLS